MYILYERSIFNKLNNKKPLCMGRKATINNFKFTIVLIST